jgi:hypothetical protein
MGREFEFNELLVQLQREDEKIMPWIKKRKTDETDKKPRYNFFDMVLCINFRYLIIMIPYNQ